jgi:hypothetical protein
MSDAKNTAPDAYILADCFGEIYDRGTRDEMDTAWGDWGDDDPAAVEVLGLCVIPSRAFRRRDTLTGRVGWVY